MNKIEKIEEKKSLNFKLCWMASELYTKRKKITPKGKDESFEKNNKLGKNIKIVILSGPLR